MGVSPIWIIPATGLAATLFWDGSLVLPAKLLTVLIHEMGHALAAMIGGAQVERIVISMAESGETIVSRLHGTAQFTFAVSAGYIGSALVGATCLNRGIVGRLERVTLLSFSLGLAYMSLLFTTGADAAFLTGFGWSIAMLVPVVLGRRASRATLLAVGTLLLWYCFFDLFDFAAPGSRTDADILADFFVTQGIVDQTSRSFVTTAIAASWALSVALCLYATLRGPAAEGWAPRGSAGTMDMAELGPDVGQESFPGDLTPEVELWLMARGLGADCQPLLPEGIELPAGAPTKESAGATVVSPGGT